MNHVVKRKGHAEVYDARKLYASIYSACTAVRETQGASELIAEKVVASVEEWLEKKHEVTSKDIKRVAHTHLDTYNREAAYLYNSHGIVW